MPDLTPIVTVVEQFLRQPGKMDAARVFHGRGNCYPGLHWCTVDAFAPTLLLTLFAPPPEQALEQLQARILALFPCAQFNRVAVQHRYLADAPYTWLLGEPLVESYARRGEQRFALSFSRQNVGFFLDMESARRWLEERAQGAKVLNLFSYTCVFSVVAQAAGASSVVNVDMSKSALSRGRENHRVNGLATDTIQFMPLDILKSWSRIKKPGPYDIVIIDPPSFQKGSFVAERDYVKVVRRLSELVTAGGDVLACLNAPELNVQYLLDVFAEHAGHCRFVQRLPLPPVFCDTDSQRQLKLLHFHASDIV